MAGQESGMLLGPVAVNGFPARRMTNSNTYQGGEWVTAYQAEQRTRLRAVFFSQQQQQKKRRAGEGSWTLLSPPVNTREVSGVGRRVLDREFLMRHCFVERPSDLSHADITGVHQNTYKPEDFCEFDCLVHMIASDSALPMEAFKTFPVLEHLELCVCCISDISLTHSDFTKLQCLDLSYNAVSEEAVLALGTLPELRELHLTGNDIVSLPVDMSRPFNNHNESSDKGSSLGMRFAVLETLWLDDNKLTDQTTFSTLAGLRRLKYVNLDNNELYSVPQLRLIGTSRLRSTNERGSSSHTRTSATPRPGQRSTESRGQGSSGGKDVKSFEETFERGNERATDSATTRTVTLVSEGGSGCEGEKSTSGDGDRCAGGGNGDSGECEGRETGGPTETPVSVTGLPPSMAPFPQLHTLSLANNLFFSSEELLACGLWPALKELIIHGNPLVSMCKGMPPQLQSELVQKRNMHIMRHKPRAKTFRIREKAKAFKKIPPDSANESQLALPAPPHTVLPLPSPPTIPQSPTSHPHTHTGSDRGEADGCEDSVFITQGKGEQDDAGRKMLDGDEREEDRRREKRSVKREMVEWEQSVREKYATADLPRHYRGYEALLEEDTAPVPHIPTDLHACIHALRYSLKHGSAYKSAAGLRHTQRQHHTQEGQQQLMVSRMSQETTTHRKVREMHRALDDVRTSTAVLQADLAELLQMDTSKDKTTHKLQGEAKTLLKQLQAKYADAQKDVASSNHQTT